MPWHFIGLHRHDCTFVVCHDFILLHSSVGLIILFILCKIVSGIAITAQSQLLVPHAQSASSHECRRLLVRLVNLSRWLLLFAEETSFFARLAGWFVLNLNGLIQWLIFHDCVHNHAALLIIFNDTPVAIVCRRVDLSSCTCIICVIFATLVDMCEAFTSEVRQLWARLSVLERLLNNLFRLNFSHTEHAATAIAYPLLILHGRIGLIALRTLVYPIDFWGLTRHR